MKFTAEMYETTPADFNIATDRSGILIHAGDITTHQSFERFRNGVLAARLIVNPNGVEYQFGPAPICLAATAFDVDHPAGFTLPTVDGKSIDLRPSTTWQSPYLNGRFGSDKISVTVGPVKQVLDLSLEVKAIEYVRSRQDANLSTMPKP